MKYVAWSQQVSHYQPINPPENSLAIVPLAFALGFHAVEVDVQLSRDNQLVLMHDYTLDRATHGSGQVSDFTAAELASVALRGGDGRHFVSTFSDALMALVACSQRGEVMCDLRNSKRAAIQALRNAAEVSAFPMKRMMILAYDIDSAHRIKDACPESLVLLKLSERLESVPGEDALAWGDGLLLNAARSPAILMQIRQRYSGALGAYLHHRGLGRGSLDALRDVGCDLVTTQNHHFFCGS
ncbi:MAG: glycerophosphodiester phosphodiesterase family protein [Pseudoxanthomonas sp.]|nr:glycerophosphodiester phosphodiesterase family protein [Pseudoxanthomonas sp.]